MVEEPVVLVSIRVGKMGTRWDPPSPRKGSPPILEDYLVQACRQGISAFSFSIKITFVHECLEDVKGEESRGFRGHHSFVATTTREIVASISLLFSSCYTFPISKYTYT